MLVDIDRILRASPWIRQVKQIRRTYRDRPGDTIEILCLKDGKPLVNQFVQSGRETDGKVVTGRDVRTDKKGIARFKLDGAGKWYVRFINMTRLDDPKLNYESKWATLTFEIR